MRREYILILSLLFPTLTRAEEHSQLYRSFEQDKPYRGHLLGPQDGGGPEANFETCNHVRLLVDITKLQKEPGKCGDNPPNGPIEVSLEKLFGATAYSVDNKEIGKVSDIKTSTDGSIKKLIVSGTEPSGSPILYAIDWDKVELQGTKQGKFQVLVREQKNQIRPEM